MTDHSASHSNDYQKFQNEILHQQKIALVGLTNSGKSSLFNAIFGRDIAPVSAKAGFTKTAQSNERFGVLFTDTPGLQGAGEDEDKILRFVFESSLVLLVINAAVGVTDFDILLYEAATSAKPGVNPTGAKIPIIVVINKTDQIDPEERTQLEASVKERLSGADLIWVSTRSNVGIDELIARIHQKLPKPGQLWFVAHQQSQSLKRAEVKRQIWLSAGSAATAALIPLPVADIFLITPIQVYLVLKIGAIYGYELSYDRASELVGAISGSFALQTVTRQIVKLLPGYGSVISAGVAFAGTVAMGETAILYFEQGTEVSREKLRSLYQEAKKVWEKRYTNWNVDEKMASTKEKLWDLLQKAQKRWESPK